MIVLCGCMCCITHLTPSGYFWWSITHSLPAVLWFYPLCAMEVSGYEVVAFFWMSPVVMAIGPLRRFLTSPFGLMLMRVCAMMGVASYQAPSILSRLVILGVGNFFAMLVLAGTWWDKSKLDRYFGFTEASHHSYSFADIVTFICTCWVTCYSWLYGYGEAPSTSFS